MQASRRTISILISSFLSSSSLICFLYLSFSIKHCEYWVCASSREWKACEGWGDKAAVAPYLACTNHIRSGRALCLDTHFPAQGSPRRLLLFS